MVASKKKLNYIFSLLPVYVVNDMQTLHYECYYKILTHTQTHTEKQKERWKQEGGGTGCVPVHYLYAFKRLYLPQNGCTAMATAAATAAAAAMTAAGACNMPANNAR